MVTYRQRHKSSTWIVGIVVFLLAMVITFSDLYGMNRFCFGSPGSGQDNNTGVTMTATKGEWQDAPSFSCEDPNNVSVPLAVQYPSVPEPATVMLLALGCGLLAAGTRRK
jgi:hypothetical protein